MNISKLKIEDLTKPQEAVKRAQYPEYKPYTCGRCGIRTTDPDHNWKCFREQGEGRL